ncbi:MAG: diaminopimelate epimerase [Bacteroidota bacterium]
MINSQNKRSIPFYKYQGTGNDFILIDNRGAGHLQGRDTALIQQLCDRRFGIGADGLILLQERQGYDFEMVYFNADGRESSMCGNGGRCITAFAKFLDIIGESAHFLAIDGPHDAFVGIDNWVELKMTDVPEVEQGEDYFLLDTGSPHYIVFVEDIDDIDVIKNGQAIRYSKRFREEGVNVNFVEKKRNGIMVATYERGVEGETLSCGTGVTAAAIAYGLQTPEDGHREVAISSKGGRLKVRFQTTAEGKFYDIWLGGGAEQVFSGSYLLS